MTDGAPDMQSIEGTSLLYVANTEHNLFRDINTQSMYLLCSGRWFTAKSESGPWTYMDPESLPADFKKIPRTAGPADVLASVPGTEESKEAILEAQIPRTAAVQRSTGKLNVVYDGEAKIIGAGVEALLYATNTATRVFLLGGRYYACDNAVWFESDGANGPWIVADKIPDQIYKLPPLFAKKPYGKIAFYDEVQPHGPSAPLKSLDITNPKYEQHIEKAYYDTDLKAKDAILDIYKNGVFVSKIQRAFSVGAFGVKKNRRFVPTAVEYHGSGFYPWSEPHGKNKDLPIH